MLSTVVQAGHGRRHAIRCLSLSWLLAPCWRRSWPREVGQEPINVGDGKVGLFPFGFGITPF